MKKITATILSALVFTALCSSGTAIRCAFDEPSRLPVSADGQSVSSGVSNELISPTSYEQYLSLTKPAAVAANADCTAIADGKTLFVYDRAYGLYREYVHSADIHRIRLDNAGNLYFLSELYLYKLPLQALRDNAVPEEEEMKMDIVCTGFTINEDTLYYYASSSGAIKFYSLSQNKELGSAPIPGKLQYETPLAFGKDSVYCVCENETEKNAYTVYAINVQTGKSEAITNFGEQIHSLVIASNLFCFVSQSGDFYTYNVTELSASERAEALTPITKDEGGYVSLCTYGDNVYAIRNDGVRHYSVSEATFTEYEIGASSASAHRLSGATELILSENRLFIADGNNERISVYDTETQTFGTAISSPLSDPYLASYKETLLVSSQTEAILYSLSAKTYGTELVSIDQTELAGNVVGAASVYGRYYLVTDNNYCYMLSAESGEWLWTETHKNTQTLRATAFTADVYGSLYVAYDNDAVYRFTEKELMSADASGTKILEDLRSPEKLAVDYETNLYALANGAVTCYAPNAAGVYETKQTYIAAEGLVKDDSPTLRSFAFGVEDKNTYFLYGGDYVVKSDIMAIPVVDPIPVGNATELVYGESNTDFSVVTIATDSILIEFDVAALREATEFPYIAFERAQKPQTALKLGEEGDYSIVAVAKERTGQYETYLVLTSSCTPLEHSEYYIAYGESKTGHLTNAVSLYKFPYLTELLTVGNVARGETVTLVGEVDKLDHAYYQIRFETEGGESKTAFIPKAYVTLFDGSAPSPETVTFGASEAEEDSVWRCIYLILGFGAIGILVDYLILRKPKDTEL